jgi:hypothetical protein
MSVYQDIVIPSFDSANKLVTMVRVLRAVYPVDARAIRADDLPHNPRLGSAGRSLSASRCGRKADRCDGPMRPGQARFLTFICGDWFPLWVSHLIRIAVLRKERIVSAGIMALHARIVRTSVVFVAGDELSLGSN